MTWPCQASEHDADHGQPDEGSNGPGVSLEIARQAAIAADPCQGAFDDPALGQDDEFVQFVALDDLEHPTTGAGSRSRGAWSLIAGIGEDALDEGKKAAGASIENHPRPVAVLNVGGWTTTFSRRPSVSTRIWRLRPVTFLPASNPCGSSAEPLFEHPWRFGCR